MPASILRSRRRVDLGALAGVLGVLVPAVGLVVLPIWEFPGTSATGAQIVSFVADRRGELRAVMVLNTVGVTLWLVFGMRVWGALRRSDDGGGTQAVCWAAGVVALVTLLLAGFSVFDVLVYRPPSPQEAKVLYDLTFGLLALSGPPTAVALLAYAGATLDGRVLPRYTAVLAVLAAAAHLALPLSFVFSGGFLSLEGQVITVAPAFLWAWILLTALEVCRTSGHRLRGQLGGPRRASRLRSAGG